MNDRVLVAGVGNIFLGDDAFGSEVARRLLRDRWPENVRIVDFGIRGVDLTFALLDGYETVILIDATARGGTPGTLYTIEADCEEVQHAAVDAHVMDPMRVFAAARSMSAQWKRLLVVGCEPTPGAADPDGPGEMGMTPPVERAVEEAEQVIRRLLCESKWVS